MKYVLRKFTAMLVRLTTKLACSTYGETAELSSGPCQRCVGRAVTGPMEQK